MKDYTIDPKTGFLTPGPGLVGPGFNAEQKTLFLARYRESYNVSKAAEESLVTRAVVMKHKKEDKAFGEAFEATEDALLDEIQESLYKQSKKSPIAVMQILKNKRSEEWGQKKTIEAVDKTSDKLKDLLK